MGSAALGGVIATIMMALLLWKSAIPRLNVGFAIVGATCLTGALATWLGIAGGFVLRLLDGIGLYLVGVAVSAFVLIPLLFIVIFDVVKKKANRRTVLCAFSLPYVGLATSGAIGAAITSAALAVGGGLGSLAAAL